MFAHLGRKRVHPQSREIEYLVCPSPPRGCVTLGRASCCHSAAENEDRPKEIPEAVKSVCRFYSRFSPSAVLSPFLMVRSVFSIQRGPIMQNIYRFRALLTCVPSPAYIGATVQILFVPLFAFAYGFE